MDRGFIDESGADALNSYSLQEVPNSRGRKNLFGRADLAATYRRACDLIVRHRVFRMVQVEHGEDGAKRIIICNLWRIDRQPDGGVKTLEFLLNEERWVETSAFDYWPDVPFFPIKQTQSLEWWREVATQAIWKALVVAGYHALPQHLSQVVWEADAVSKIMPDSPRPDMAPSKMAYILIQKYIGKQIGYTKEGKPKWVNGFLKPKTMMAGARALRAAIFDHLLDADVLSALLAIDYKKLITLKYYLGFARHRDGLLRVSREHRNLLPLLPEIDRAYWNRKDLFSRKLWVRDGRKRTLVDYRKFMTIKSSSNRFASFDSRGAFRWLCKAQLTVVRHWVSAWSFKNLTVLENIAKANINVHIPAIAWRHMVTYRQQLDRIGVCEPVQRLYRLYASHCAALWKDRGFTAVKEWLRSETGANLGDLADWLAAEGLAQGQPDRNATWASLQRRCADWHERVALENIERSMDRNLTWESLVPELEVDGVKLTPLNSTEEIALEGYRQHHCVGGYDLQCAAGQYRVYTVVEPDGTRSTLGLWLPSGKGGRWLIDQHRGKYNGGISDVARAAGEHLLRLYQDAYRANKSQPVRR